MKTSDSAAGTRWRRFLLEGQTMALEQILCALYVALCEASGPQARAVANRVLLDAIKDQSVDDQQAVDFLQSLCAEEDEEASEMVH